LIQQHRGMLDTLRTLMLMLLDDIVYCVGL